MMMMMMMMIIVHLYSAHIHYLPKALYKTIPMYHPRVKERPL